MAFAATNQKTINLGGGMRLTRGQWTGSAGDSTGTLTVQGGVLWSSNVWSNLAGRIIQAPCSFSSSGNAITITVENVEPVTDGYFTLLHG